MAQILGTLAKWAIPVGLAVGGAQTAMYDGNVANSCSRISVLIF